MMDTLLTVLKEYGEENRKIDECPCLWGKLGEKRE